MKKLMFYCQHILGIGHLVRSMEIVRALIPDFQICFINGGEKVPGFQIPAGIHLVNLPAIKTDAEFRSLQSASPDHSLEEIEIKRKQILLTALELYDPDILMVELFPFGRRRFSFELIPVVEQAKQQGAKVVCSLRDIVVTKQDQTRHEEKVCKLINRYFDLLLIHGDPIFQPLQESFSRVDDLDCQVRYTGYVVQPVLPVDPQVASPQNQPLILASVGGGRFGHDLLESVVRAAPLLADRLPHQIRLFTGPLAPESVFESLVERGKECPNLTIERFTPNLVGLMQQADLSISMAGYNTTMNVLSTGVRAMMKAFTGNDDQEQRMRSHKLADLGLISMIEPEDLTPDRLVDKAIACLERPPVSLCLDLDGARKTAFYLKDLLSNDRPEVNAA